MAAEAYLTQAAAFYSHVSMVCPLVDLSDEGFVLHSTAVFSV
jgi:hypothetical protein